MKLKCIIVDDEEAFIELMEIFVRIHPNLELVRSCRSASDAREFLSRQVVDLIFLDIEMPGMIGIELVKFARNLPQVIFVSSHSEFAAEAFDYDVTDFLVKPPTERRFNQAVKKAVGIANYENLVTEQECIYFNVDSNPVKVGVNDIVCVESQGDYVKMYERENQHVIQTTLNSMQDTLDSDQFMRVQRKYLVRLGAITKINEYNVELESGKAVQVSKSNRKEMYARLKQLDCHVYGEMIG
jgi:DNA-binding LytR/AlgR family response regulator